MGHPLQAAARGLGVQVEAFALPVSFAALQGGLLLSFFLYILAQQHQQQQTALVLYPFCHISNMADKKVEETVEVESSESEDVTEDPVVASKGHPDLRWCDDCQTWSYLRKNASANRGRESCFARSSQPLIFLECFSSFFAAPLS